MKILFLSIIFVYLMFFLVLHNSLISQTPYYNYLLDAFFNKRLDLSIPATFDLSLFNHKWYMYWGPAPALFVLPFYTLGGLGTKDLIYNLTAGILDIAVFYILVNEFVAYFKLKISYFSKIFIILSFAFISPVFYLSMTGNIWSTYHLIGIFYLLLFYLFLFKSLREPRKIKFFVLAVLFFNLAWMSRYTLIFNAVLFIYPIIKFSKHDKKIFKKQFSLLTIITSIFLLGFFSYNYVRFKNPLETGLSYHQGHPRYREVIKQKKFFSFSYVPHNFYYFFINPISITKINPFIKINFEGNSVFIFYPTLLLIIFFVKKKTFKNKDFKNFFIISMVVVSLSVFVYMIYFATGWTQLGSRYILDLIPLFFLLFTSILDRVPLGVRITVLSCGIFINLISLGAILQFQ